MNKKRIIKFVTILITLLLVTAPFQTVMASPIENYGLEEISDTNISQSKGFVFFAPFFVMVGSEITAYVYASTAVVLTGAAIYSIANNLDSLVQEGYVEKTVTGTETTYALKSQYQSEFGENSQENAYYDIVSDHLSEATGEDWDLLKKDYVKHNVFISYHSYQLCKTTKDRDNLKIYFKDKKYGKFHGISYKRPMNLQEAIEYMKNALETNTVGSGNGNVLTINQAAAERLCEKVSLDRGGAGFVTAKPNEDRSVRGQPELRHCHPKTLDGEQMHDKYGNSPHCHYVVYPMNL